VLCVHVDVFVQVFSEFHAAIALPTSMGEPQPYDTTSTQSGPSYTIRSCDTCDTEHGEEQSKSTTMDSFGKVKRM